MTPRRWLVAVVFLFGVAALANGQGDRPLRWGGDAAGGAPFIFGPADKLTGFEVDLAAYLGKQLGRTPVFVNADWDGLPDLLGRRNIDVAMNGMEYLPDREKEYASTIPYFVYTLRLIVRADDKGINDWADLLARPGQPRKKRVGVLRGSVAERYLRAKYKEDIEVVATKEVTETFDLVAAGQRLDATVQDSPAAVHYIEGGQFDKLRVAGDPVSPGYYVILTRKADAELREQLNAAIRTAITSGELERIYRKYKLWTPEQEQLARLADGRWPPEGDTQTDTITWQLLLKDLLRATLYTIGLACCSMPLAIALGVLVAVGRLYGPWLVRAPLTAYVEFIRGTPVLLQLYVLFFLVPKAAEWTGSAWLVAVASPPAFVVGVIGLAINYSAYEAEIYRAGLLAIPRGQLEAALALGMTRRTALWRVVLPQAVRLVVPPVTNDFIALFKDTSICSAITIVDLTGLYYQYKPFPETALKLAVIIGLLYFGMSYPLSLLARRLERGQQSVHG